jgi:hypothetical protein
VEKVKSEPHALLVMDGLCFACISSKHADHIGALRIACARGEGAPALEMHRNPACARSILF